MLIVQKANLVVLMVHVYHKIISVMVLKIVQMPAMRQSATSLAIRMVLRNAIYKTVNYLTAFVPTMVSFADCFDPPTF